MTSRSRLASFWALALALSLQGALAATSHGDTDGSAADSHAGMSMNARVAMPMPVAVETGPRDGRSDATADEREPAPHATVAHATVAKCGACSPCCIAAAPPAARLEVVRVDVSHAIADTVAMPSSSFLTEGQDRPPRAILA